MKFQCGVNSNMIANVFSFSAAISACEEEEHGEEALTLLHKMCESGIDAASQDAKLQPS